MLPMFWIWLVSKLNENNLLLQGKIVNHAKEMPIILSKWESLVSIRLKPFSRKVNWVGCSSMPEECILNNCFWCPNSVTWVDKFKYKYSLFAQYISIWGFSGTFRINVWKPDIMLKVFILILSDAAFSKKMIFCLSEDNL